MGEAGQFGQPLFLNTNQIACHNDRLKFIIQLLVLFLKEKVSEPFLHAR